MNEVELINGFENAVLVDGEPDRVYDAEDINTRYEGLVSSYGVYANIGSSCEVGPGYSEGLNVSIFEGKGEVNNHWFKINSRMELQLEPADVVLNRIDAIVVRRTAADRKIVLAVKTGELASEPAAPMIERSQEVQEIALAYVHINRNTSSITMSNIEDLRPDTNVCGFIACLVNQLDTTTLFQQYEAAQNDFITNKTEEYENWESDQKTAFDTWFNSVKDAVKATTLYREYQVVYRNNVVGQQVIEIPTAINYTPNGLDVLNVYINGRRLLLNDEYTINSEGTEITLINALTVANQDIEFVNKKSIDGQVAENVVVQVEALETKVNSIKDFNYVATGIDDNITLSNKVKAFLDGTGDYTGVADNASIRIFVNGVLGADSLIENQMMFDFNSEVTSNRKVIVDFGNATIPNPPVVTTDILAIFSSINNVIIENANVKVNDYETGTVYGFHGGVVRNCQLNITNDTATVYGAWATAEVSNSKIVVESANCCGIYGGFRINNNEIMGFSSGTPVAIVSTSGIVSNNVVNCMMDLASNVVNNGNLRI